jgi:quercetin dioxygenase-like cupin family protein
VNNFLDYRDLVGTNPEKVYKSNLFQSDKLLVGLNCLAPGQTQATHTHSEQDKFYYVVEGSGEFVVGNDIQQAGEGCTIWAASGIEHGVTNKSNRQLVLLVGIAPAPSNK